MKILRITTGLAIALALSGSFAPAMADIPEADMSLAPQHQGRVTFITGGIGEDTAKAMRTKENRYQLHVINESRNGAFVGGEHITIRDRKGRDVVSVDGGPMFFANLPPGKYTVKAEVENRAQSKTITVASNKPENLRFFW